MKRIILTGGGTAGHVTPNLALIPGLLKLGYDIRYIGSFNGIEKSLIEKEGIPFDGISSGKLRRYFSWKNFTDPFRVVKGYGDALRILKKYQPQIVFSKGGFVSVPVVLAAKHLKIPVIIHESDMTPGLANKLSISAATKICCNFPETLPYLPEGKSFYTGQPLREEIFHGNRLTGLKFAGLSSQKPVLMCIGGSSGSVKVNEALRNILPELLKDFQVIHLCGKGKTDDSIKMTGYTQFEYISDELKDLLAASDVILSRAGASAVCELLALKKPNILIPLSINASRGDQILNAKSFEKRGFSAMLEEEKLSNEVLLTTIKEVYENRQKYLDAMNANTVPDSAAYIVQIIEETALSE